MSHPRGRIDPTSPPLPDPHDADNVLYNPSLERLRDLARHDERTTEFGSPSYVSQQRSRSADRTTNAIDDTFDDEDYDLLADAVDVARNHEMVCLDRRLGRHEDHSYVCRYYVPAEYARIAYAWAKLLDPIEGRPDPDFQTIQIPSYDPIAIRVFPNAGLTTVLGSDYTGEAKKSFLRLFMWEAKRRGGLGLHAGSKRVLVRKDDGTTDWIGQLFLGLSATGKSTLTCHGYDLAHPEATYVLQDDVCALLSDGTAAGSEGGGMYIKTAGLTPAEQPQLYEAATHESAVLENVHVAADGTVDFHSDRYTVNGRAVIVRDSLSGADDGIDLARVDQLFFITRNPVMPPVVKLSPDEAAAAFMLGESVETSAGDPDRAGEAVRVVGTNPFIIGSKGEEGNRFRELVDAHDIDCFVLNTGKLGDGARDIRVRDTVAILRALARDAVTWEESRTGLTVPTSVPGTDIDGFRLRDHVEDLDSRLASLRADRRAYLAQFDTLAPDIKRAVY